MTAGPPHVILALTLPLARRLLARVEGDLMLAARIRDAIGHQQERAAAQAQKKSADPKAGATDRRQGITAKPQPKIDRLSDS